MPNVPAPVPDKPSKDKVNDLSNHYNQLYYTQNHGINLENREIFLFPREEHAAGHGDDAPGEPGIEYTLANQFIKNYNMLRRMSKDPILIHMKSCGGYWEEGMAMYDTIKQSPNTTVILSYTHARSMSSLILLAADKSVLMPHSTFMFHQGTIWTGGTGKQFQTDFEQWMKSNEQMMKIYIDRLKERGSMQGKSRKAIRNWLDKQMEKKEDVYFSAEEAVEIGFADEIFDGDWERLKQI